jgi:stage III sporulation protein AG
LPTAEGYRRELTQEIEDLCEKVQGVGRVTVLVSLEGGYEYVYAKDADGDCVSIGSGSGKQAVVQNILPPKLLGVGIVCDGGENAACRAALTELLSAALGIGSNKIYITS